MVTIFCDTDFIIFIPTPTPRSIQEVYADFILQKPARYDIVLLETLPEHLITPTFYKK